jgi:hypothetical protein
MFTNKKTKLFDNTMSVSKASVSSKSETSNSVFVQTAMKTGAETKSANGSLKYSTTGNDFVDQFGNISTYKAPRSFDAISKDQTLLWGQNKLMTVAFTLYLRMITRTTDVFGVKTAVPQKGAEMRHEGIMRMLWLHLTAPKVFWSNITLMIAVGSWKDIFTMLQYDLVYNGWDDRKLNWDKFGKLILTGLNDETQNNLVKKYLPQVKAKSLCKTVESQADTMIAKWVCSLLYGGKSENKGSTYKMYRTLKSSGTAHEWQKLISQGKHALIDFNSIHGRALNKMVRSKYLTNQGLLEKYENWITKDTTEAKYTGFVHELFENLPSSLASLGVAKATTIDKQFTTLVNKAKSSNDRESNLIVVRDTSFSMGSKAVGTNMTANDVAKSIALYFSEFLTGRFENAWIEFNTTAKMHTWKGETATEKWYNDNTTYLGSTNFQSVIKLFVELKNQGVTESEFPTGILCISDGEFNPSSQLNESNVEIALSTLKNGGFSNTYVNNFVIALWNLPYSYYGEAKAKFETFGDVKNVFYMSGYSPSIVSFLTNDIKTAAELFEAAMDQEVLSMVKL